jgi:hypothetical protein
MVGKYNHMLEAPVVKGNNIKLYIDKIIKVEFSA